MALPPDAKRPRLAESSAPAASGPRPAEPAYTYHNQDVVAEAIVQSGVDPKELFITSQIPKCVGNAADYIEQDLQQLVTDNLDLVLIHVPNGGIAMSPGPSLRTTISEAS